MHTGNTRLNRILSWNLAGICEWEVLEETSVGRDHFPVLCSVLLQTNKKQGEILGKWVFSSAKWEMFKYMCETELDKIQLNGRDQLILDDPSTTMDLAFTLKGNEERNSNIWIWVAVMHLNAGCHPPENRRRRRS